MKVPYFYEILGAGLTAGCLFHPAASACGLLFVCSAKLAEKYFTKNISDPDREAIKAVREECGSIRADYAKLKERVEKDSLAKAFNR